MNVESESRTISMQNRMSRLPMLKNQIRNDAYHSHTFFPSVNSSQGHTCSQLFIGEKTDFMHVEPIKVNHSLNFPF